MAVWNYLEQQVLNPYIRSIPSQWQPITNQIPQAEMHQPSAEVPQQQTDYRAKSTSRYARLCRKHDAAISINTNTCTHLARAGPLSIVYSDVLQLVQQLRFVQLRFLLPAAVLHADKEDASKKGDGSLHWEMQCILTGCFKNPHSTKLTIT